LGSHELSHPGSHELSHSGLQFGSHRFSQHEPRSTVCLWPSEFVCVFDCVAVLWFDASTRLPLFWLTSPPFRKATFLPLVTTGADEADWSALFSDQLD